MLKSLKRRSQTTLKDVIEENGGLSKGLSELFGYIGVLRSLNNNTGDRRIQFMINSEKTQILEFNSELHKSIVVPEIIILR